MKRGLFITFEGIDGCGKSTQTWNLGKYLANFSKYNHIVMTREPYKNQDIRAILQAENDPYSKARELAEMFVKDRENHLKELICPSLNQGRHVISDRYDFSTLAYQQTQGMKFEELFRMHQGFLIPDITFIVDVSVETAIERMKKDNIRTTEQKFEKDKEFIEKLRRNYLDISSRLSGIRNIVLIDGTKSPEEIFEKQIKPAFDKFYNAHILN